MFAFVDYLTLSSMVPKGDDCSLSSWGEALSELLELVAVAVDYNSNWDGITENSMSVSSRVGVVERINTDDSCMGFACGKELSDFKGEGHNGILL
jgi:hypothetical protein